MPLPLEVINEHDYRQKSLQELESLRGELLIALKSPREEKLKLRDDVNLWIINDLIREKDDGYVFYEG